ncbi:Guanine nucleotide-binding protein, beta subunit [Trema orientale]|uniref:Guanine nucleotide-binding protein, beta subunit n=1 Tax=Trema orientale TaxID=63057 RepID=A0A2P5FHK2_TREOI|nr:Guanine nucleotide-binding protein, beta subunit [Trema orientale]
MTKLKGDEEKPDGLEITSIGSLYGGPWDKKYWSSSRGKDRYPYPVGYHAVRAHNGITYKMEIHEGPKGPLFMIASADGHSSSGQTPDIAWEKFQKKCSSRVKILHGKRFSCNIDGVEFFGFKNPFVQRLLREMVANVSGTAEQNLLCSSFCKEAPKVHHISDCSDACKDQDLMPYLASSHITRKRSKRCEITSTKSSSKVNLKRSRCQDLTKVAEALDQVDENQRIHDIGNPLPSFKDDSSDCKQPPVLPPSMNSMPVHEEKSHISENDLTSRSVDIYNHLQSVVPTEEKMMLIGSRNCTSTGLTGTLPNKEKPLGRLRGTEVKVFNSSMALEVNNGELTGPGDRCDVNDVELYIPDTLDLVPDSTSDSGPNIHYKSSKSFKEEITAADMVISEGLGSEPHPEEEIGTSNSNVGSEKSDFDSVGQETAKSMMTFLLPQAIPLLKKASMKKNSALSPLEILPRGLHSEKQSRAVMVTDNKMGDMKEPMNIQTMNLGSSDAGKDVTINNLVDHISGNHVSCHDILPSGDTNADQVSFNEEASLCITWGQSTGVEEHNEFLDCCHETNESKDIFCYDEVHVESSGMLRQVDGDIISESLPSCSVPNRKEFAEEIRDAFASIDEHSEAVRADDVKLQGTLTSPSMLQEESGVKTAVEETGNMPFTQVPSLVYSRRKKVQTIKPKKGKYNGPLSESIICRSFGDSCVPETCPTTRNFTNLETLEMGSSDDKSRKKDVFGSKPKISGQSKNIPVDTAKVDCTGLLNNVVSAVSQDQSLMHASKDKETMYCLDQPSSHVHKPCLHVDKEMTGDKNLLVPKSSESYKKHGTSIFNSSSYIAKEFQCSSNFRPKNMAIEKDLVGIFDFVGCYLHPLPVLSTIVSTGGKEIHICVLCGLTVDKNRTLFIYKVATQEPTAGYPSFIGHTSVTLPILKDYFGREIALERSGLQFTPGGKYLLLLDSIKIPYCRQGRIPCMCSACASCSFEENVVKIVKVNFGYVSVVEKLITNESLQCLLVCEPNHLVAVGESGRIHLWVMNSTWSAQTEKFIMPANDFVSPGILEIKKIPKCTSLILGHNGFGEFSLWDISKRIIVSKFSASCTSFCEFFPVGMFSWQKKGHSFRDSNVEGHVNGMVAATNMWFSDQANDDPFLPLDGEDIAVWLLVSATSDSDAEHDYISGDYQTKSVGWWRLALLVKNMVILGTALDPSAAATGASAGYGIIGTCDGLVYLWEMSTGTKLGSLHHFRGSTVSCIATDDSKKGAGAVAIAGGEGELLVYLPSQKNMAK